MAKYILFIFLSILLSLTAAKSFEDYNCKELLIALQTNKIKKFVSLNTAWKKLSKTPSEIEQLILHTIYSIYLEINI